MDDGREEFEDWISSPPFGHSIDRFPEKLERYAWPGNYVCIDVQLAWCAWKESRKTAREHLSGNEH
jgi:hypothetical protein